MTGENGLLKQITKAVLEAAIQAEMEQHLGYKKYDPAGHVVLAAMAGLVVFGSKLGPAF